jgi:hypothetical protein
MIVGGGARKQRSRRVTEACRPVLASEQYGTLDYAPRVQHFPSCDIQRRDWIAKDMFYTPF